MKKYIFLLTKLAVYISLSYYISDILLEHLNIDVHKVLVILLTIILFFINDFNLDSIKNRIIDSDRNNIDKTWDE